MRAERREESSSVEKRREEKRKTEKQRDAKTAKTA